MANKPLVLAALAALSACGPLVQIGGGGEPPPSLLNLRASAAPVSTRADPANTLTVATPSVPGALQTLRLPVLTADTEVAYLKQATWIEQPAKLFQRLLADTLASRGGATVVDIRQSDVPPVRKLTGQLLDFGLDVRDPAAPVVRVRYDATLSGREGKLLIQRRFEATRPVAAQTPAVAGAALNTAANAVANDVAAWVAAN